jgi:predicted ATPase/DNA-binding SARP family transcriptional activator
MSELRLSVLSGLSIEYDGKPVTDLTSLKTQALLVYLAITGRPQSRQALAGLLWPDVKEELARTSLRKVLAQVRRAVGDHVQTDRHTIWFNRQRPNWVDALVFEEACRRLRIEAPGDGAAQRLLREAVYLYRDGFLAGFPETDATLFEEWALQHREHYCLLALDALQGLAADALERNDLRVGIIDVRRALELDPLFEEAHRLLMQLHASSGNTVAALRQYDECVRILDAELAVPPGDDTTALAQALREGRWASAVPEQEAATSHEVETAIPNSLPATLTPILGRDVELSTLDEMLASNDIRLISVVGPGGMGKTRLSLAAAERQAETHRFSQGVCFVELATLGEPERIVNVIAEAIRFPLQLGVGEKRTPRERLLDYLRAKEMLLVLDNFEHLLESADLVDEILQAAPSVKILSTSRERLRLRGEQVLPIRGLDYDSTDGSALPAVPPAAQLFVQSAQRIAPDFVASDEELAQILQICRLVEGLPLAIELAASWVELLPPHEILQELRSSLDILETQRRGMPDRHRSIRAVFDTSWHSLDEPTRGIFAALSIFRGGFTRTAAQEVAGATLSQLRTLAGKSLIQFDRQRNRYTLHETLRQYGAERLAEAPEAEKESRRRHSVCYCSLVQTLGEELLGVRQMEAIAELEQEAENLRVAWQWAVNQHNWELVGRAIDGLGFFYEWQGRLEDGEIAFQMASNALRADGSPDTQLLMAQACVWCSAFIYPQARMREAEDLLAEALRLLQCESTDDETRLEREAFAWLRSGIHAFWQDDKKARDSFTRSLSRYQTVGNKWGIARALSGLAQADAGEGNYAEAESRFRRVLDLLQEIGDRRSEAHSLHRLAIMLRNAGGLDEAVSLARKSYQLYSEMEDRAGIAWSGQILAECLSFVGAHGEAIDLLRMAEALATDLGDWNRLANVYQEQVLVLSRMGQHTEAYEAGEKGLALARRLAMPTRMALCQLMLVPLDLNAGETEAAALRLQESEQLMKASARGHQLAIVYALQACVALVKGGRIHARQLTLTSLHLSSQHRDQRVFLGLRALILLLADVGRMEDALALSGYLEKSPVGHELVAFFWQRFASVVEQMSLQAIDEAKARCQGTDLWELVALWIAELEQMGEMD